MQSEAAPGLKESDLPRAEGALCAALANCLINADYYGKKSVAVRVSEDEIIFINPGEFCIEVDEAKENGISAPRNAAVMKMFNLIGVGNGSGSGLQSIYITWKSLGFPEPVIMEDLKEHVTRLIMPFKEQGSAWG
ncbi:MAG: AAA family ATPase, partial [Lachnospiraceae bacterium]|nr:AAA family ATPase [Lachnospiraceae bacterium]